MANGDRIQELIDRQDIIDVALRYARALDTKNYTALTRCFTPDAIYGDRCGHAEIEAIARAALEPLDCTQHITTNFQVKVDGDRAHMDCYFHAQHVRGSARDGTQLIIAGTYEDQLVRTADGWKFQSRLLHVLWRNGNPDVLAW
jgi:3-phenylpropionate/cinnamic acid dioxygenase small subunit